MKMEKFQKYAAVAEIVSAVAIVISLVYVGYEFRRTQTLSSNDVDKILFERVQEMNGMLIQVPDLANLVLLAQNRSSEIKDADRIRYLAYQHMFFDSWEVSWLYHEDGILDDRSWQEWNEWFASEARARPLFGWVENRRHFPGAEFMDHVDQLLTVR